MSLPRETRETILESCRFIAARMGEAQARLLQPGLEALDHCTTELSEAIVALERLAAAGPEYWSPEAGPWLREIKSAAGRLRPQIEHASRVCLGWIQMRLATGYTRQGSPVWTGGQTNTSFEA